MKARSLGMGFFHVFTFGNIYTGKISIFDLHSIYPPKACLYLTIKIALQTNTFTS
jgi:hypothetical protein